MATKKTTSKKPVARKNKSTSKARGTVAPRRKGLSGFFSRLSRVQGMLLFGLVFAITGSVFLLVSNAANAPTAGYALYWDHVAPPLRSCESTNNYSVWNSSGHWGAYQFDSGTWSSYWGAQHGYKFGDSKMPHWVQDRSAYQLYLSRGLGPWSCGSYASSHQSSTCADSTGNWGPQPSCTTPTPTPTPQPGSHPTPVTCHYIGVKYGHRAYNCDFFSNTPIYNYNTRVGYFRGSPDWIICQENSATFHKSSSVYNVYWGYTLSDSPAHWGWVNATYAKTGTNNGLYGGVPDCSSAGISTSNAGHVPTLTHP